MDWLKDTPVLVLGLGDSGLAMARWCARFGAQVTVWDSREQPPGAAALREQYPQVLLRGDALDASALQGMQLVLKSPGLAPHDARVAAVLNGAREAGIALMGELDLFARALADLKAMHGYAPQVLAITGTNGKTTTTALTALLVERAGRRVAMAGNIGPTLLDTLAAALDAAGPELEARRVDAAVAGDEGFDKLSPNGGDESAMGEAVLPVRAEPVEAGTPPVCAEPVEAQSSPARAEPVEAQPSAARAEPVEAQPSAVCAEPVEAQPSPARAEPVEAQPTPVRAELVEAPATDATPLPIAPPPPAPPELPLPQVWVLELSSFQLEGGGFGLSTAPWGFEPSAATVLNITQDHLDWHGSMVAYTAAKARIYGRQAVMVVNGDDPAVVGMVPVPDAAPAKAAKGAPKVKFVPREVLQFSLHAPARPGDFGLVVENGMAWLVRALPQEEGLKLKKGEQPEIHLRRLMPADALRIRGRHNAANALAALALATAIGCPLAPMLHGLREYAGEPHRVQFVASVPIDGGEVEAFDDSKGTNVGATVAALDGLGADKAPGQLVVILGGDGKGQDFTPLGAPLARHARAVATIGRDAAAIEAVVEQHARGLPLQRFVSLELAVQWCFAQARRGDAVLLSPACASLDMFRNYAHRAEVFVAAVQAYAAERGQA